MASNTVRTVLGFLRAALVRQLPLLASKPSLPDIYNYVEIEGLFPTSGQPSEAELGLICDAGYTKVVNLAPTSVLENSVVAEAEILGARGVQYVHMPVDFKDPTNADFDRFVAELDASDGERLWVHCAANMRVSAFVYRYRVAVRGESPERAGADLAKIWAPFGAWQRFLRDVR